MATPVRLVFRANAPSMETLGSLPEPAKGNTEEEFAGTNKKGRPKRPPLKSEATYSLGG